MSPSRVLRVRFSRFLILLLALPFVTPGQSFAASGDLDPFFGSFSGKAQFDLGGDEAVQDIAAYPTGTHADKLVVAGSSGGQPGEGDALLMQHSSIGSLDTSFRGEGFVTTSVDEASTYSAAEVDPSGERIAAVGYGIATSLRRSSLIHIFYPTGTFSSEFGEGAYLTDLPQPNQAEGVVWQDDGKVVVGGWMETPVGEIQPLLLRLCHSTDGVTCGGNGHTVLDSSFNGDGVVTLTLRALAAFDSFTIQPDGRIIAAGTSYSNLSPASSDMVIMRFNSNGTVDESFGTGGITFIDFDQNDYPKGLELQEDGKILVGGYAAAPNWISPGTKFALARLTEHGELDSSFGSGGQTMIDFGSPDNYGDDIALQPDGKIIQVGPTTDGDWAVVRYNQDGFLDCSFSRDGKTTGPWTDSFVSGVVVLSDVRIVAAGSLFEDDQLDVALASYQGGNSPCPLKWSGFEKIVTPPINSGVDVASWEPNRLDVFGRMSADNSFGHVSWNSSSWSSMESLGGTFASDPSAVSWEPNRVDVFGAGTDSGLWHKYWGADGWSSWVPLGGSLKFSPDVASWGPNRLDVFGVGADNALWHRSWDGSSWSAWESLGGALTSSPGAVATEQDHVYVFARGTDGAIWYRFWSVVEWSFWQPLHGSLKSGPDASSWGPERFDIVAIGRDDAVWQHAWEGTQWSPWEMIGGLSPSDPGIVSWGEGRVDLFLRGMDDGLWHAYGLSQD